MTDVREDTDRGRDSGTRKPPGTTPTDGSITAVGTEMRSYYGRPIVKEPVWQPEIPFYFFAGGLGGASSVLHGIATLTGHEKVATASSYIGAAADLASPVLLISDLGRPERFLNMLRVFKVTSPMSVGSWILTASAGASVSGATLELLGILKPLRLAAETVAFLTGPGLATYTGTLIANTAIPVWNEGRQELPWLFGASGAASAGAAAALFVAPAEAGLARRVAVGGVAAELGIFEAMRRRIGLVGEVYSQGDSGRLAKLSKACTVGGAGLLATAGKRHRAAAVAGSALVLAGEVALRWSVFKAGFQSARDPKYTVVPQRERLAKQKEAAA
jgi:formate-dependent nitrite reductase membrane component NrfD